MIKKHLVRHLRRRLGLTQAQLGVAIGQCQPYVSDIERGVRPVLAVATLEKLAEALGVTLDSLLTGDERRRRTLVRWQEERQHAPARERTGA